MHLSLEGKTASFLVTHVQEDSEPPFVAGRDVPDHVKLYIFFLNSSMTSTHLKTFIKTHSSSVVSVTVEC